MCTKLSMPSVISYGILLLQCKYNSNAWVKKKTGVRITRTIINTIKGQLCSQAKCNFLVHTLYNELLRIARNLLETRENIKIESCLFYHIICDWFSWGSRNFFFEKKIQNGHFSKSPIFKKKNCENFMDWSLG